MGRRQGPGARAESRHSGHLLNTFPGKLLDNYINSVFSQYASSPPLTASVNARRSGSVPIADPTVTYNFTGSTAGGEFVFSDATKGGAIFSFAKWSTFDAYEGFFPYGSMVPKDSCERPDFTAAEAVKARLQGALMRTTLLVNPEPFDVPNCPNPSTFYINPPVNMYAKLWHAAGIEGKAYGFGFDDNCAQSSFKLIFNPTKLTIRLLGNRP